MNAYTEGPQDSGQLPSPFPGRRAFCRSLLAGAASTLLTRRLRSQEAPTTATLRPSADQEVPADYVGLSYETMQLADPSFFAPDNLDPIALFKSLTFRGVLCIGGNSSEFC